MRLSAIRARERVANEPVSVARNKQLEGLGERQRDRPAKAVHQRMHVTDEGMANQSRVRWSLLHSSSI